MPSTNPKLLSAIGPREVHTSDELISRLVTNGMSEDAARKMLSRAATNGDVWRSENFRLSSNGRLFAHPDFAGTPEFYKQAALKVSETDRKGISRCLSALAKECAVIDHAAMKLVASPTNDADNAEKYPNYSDEVLALKEFGVSENALPNGQTYLYSNSVFSEDDPTLAATAWNQVSQFRIECMLGRLLVDSLRRQNVVSWNRYQVAEPSGSYPNFNGQLFTAHGFSFLRPLAKWDGTKPKGCPVLIEVCPGPCESYRFESFVERILRATYRGESQQNYLGILAATDFDAAVWSAARAQSLWTINLRQTYGEAALEILAQFETLLRSVETSNTIDPKADLDSLANLLAELKTNPIVVDLKSMAFEVLTALVMRANGFEDVSMGTDVPFLQTTRDADVHGRRGDIAAITECKAISADNTLLDSDVTKFFTETVPAFATWYRANRGGYSELQAELWTTGQIGNNAQKAFDELQLAAPVKAKIKSSEEIKDSIPSQLKPRLEKLLAVIGISGQVAEKT